MLQHKRAPLDADTPATARTEQLARYGVLLSAWVLSACTLPRTHQHSHGSIVTLHTAQHSTAERNTAQHTAQHTAHSTARAHRPSAFAAATSAASVAAK